jgi:hypothetical protein
MTTPATTELASLPGALAREFPDWEIIINPGGLDICTAYWRSPDGRSRRVVVTRSGGDLLTRLRAIGKAQAESVGISPR